MAYTNEYDPYYRGNTDGYFGYYLPSSVTLSCRWRIDSQNIVENYSTVTFEVSFSSNVSNSELRANGSTIVQLIVDGAFVKQWNFTSSTQVEYYTMDFHHNDYGQRIIVPALNYANYGKEQYGNVDTAPLGWGLKTIPQGARLLSAPTAFHDEENPVITYTSYEIGATALITTNTNSKELDIVISHPLPTAEETATYTFELTEDERDELRLRCKNANSMKLYFGVYCVVKGEVIYTHREATFSVINANPTATGTVKDINPITLALTGDENTLIRFVSTAQVKAQYTAIKKAAIAGYWIEHNSNIFPETSHDFEKVEGNIFAFHITDSRGNTGESFIQSPMIEYTKLTCNIDSSEKPDTDGVMNLKCGGNFYNDTFGYTDDAVANTLQVQYRYKPQGGTYTAWTDLSHTINNDGTYEASTTISGLVYTTTYVFQCRAIDRLSDIQSIEYVAKSLPVFHWGENDFVFEVPVTFNSSATGIEFPTPPPDYSLGGSMDGDLNITGDLRLKGDGNYGNTIYFGDGEYAYIQEPTDDSLTIKASVINLDGTVRLRDNPIEFGVWYPTLDNYAISSYTSNSGWYQRIGNVITIGFFIKATSRANYHTTGIVIEGLPFEPANTTAGGGMCSGAYKSAGFGFQCWAVGKDSTITARVQNTNDTSAANLSTSASGLFYPYGGGEVTLSGTISYLI